MKPSAKNTLSALPVTNVRDDSLIYHYPLPSNADVESVRSGLVGSSDLVGEPLAVNARDTEVFRVQWRYSETPSGLPVETNTIPAAGPVPPTDEEIRLFYQTVSAYHRGCQLERTLIQEYTEFQRKCLPSGGYSEDSLDAVSQCLDALLEAGWSVGSYKDFRPLYMLFNAGFANALSETSKHFRGAGKRVLTELGFDSWLAAHRAAAK